MRRIVGIGVALAALILTSSANALTVGRLSLLGEFGPGVALNADGTTALVGGGWVLTRSGSIWTEQARLSPPFDGYYDPWSMLYDGAVALSGNTALIGAPGEHVIRVYERSGETWTQTASLPGDGEAIALSGNTALIGLDNRATVFVDEGGTWSEQATLPAPAVKNLKGVTVPTSASFGFSVALKDNTAAVGSPTRPFFYEKIVLVNGKPTPVEVEVPNAGAVTTFTRSGSTWTQTAMEINKTETAGQELGYDVAVSGSTAVGVDFRQSIAVEGSSILIGDGQGYAKPGGATLNGESLSFPGATARQELGTRVALSEDGSVGLVAGPCYWGGCGEDPSVWAWPETALVRPSRPTPPAPDPAPVAIPTPPLPAIGLANATVAHHASYRQPQRAAPRKRPSRHHKRRVGRDRHRHHPPAPHRRVP